MWVILQNRLRRLVTESTREGGRRASIRPEVDLSGSDPFTHTHSRTGRSPYVDSGTHVEGSLLRCETDTWLRSFPS